MAFRTFFVAKKDPNLSHRIFKHGLVKTKYKHSKLTPAAVGKTAILKGFIVVFLTNV